MISTVAALHGATVEERLDQINQFSEKARSETLEKEGRKGQVGDSQWPSLFAPQTLGCCAVDER